MRPFTHSLSAQSSAACAPHNVGNQLRICIIFYHWNQVERPNIEWRCMECAAAAVVDGVVVSRKDRVSFARPISPLENIICIFLKIEQWIAITCRVVFDLPHIVLYICELRAYTGSNIAQTALRLLFVGALRLWAGLVANKWNQNRISVEENSIPSGSLAEKRNIYIRIANI